MKEKKVPVWDLSFIYKSIDDELIFKDLNKYLKEATSFSKLYSNKIASLSIDNFLKAIIKYEEIIDTSTVPLWYLELNHSVDLNNQNLVSKLSQAKNIYANIVKNLDFFENELSNLEAKKEKTLLSSKKLLNYKNYLVQIFANKKHILAKEIELVLIDKDINGRSSWKDFRGIYESKLKFKFKLPGDKKEKEYIQAELVQIAAKHKDRKVRYQALETLMTEYKEHAFVFSHIYNSIIQDMILIDKNKRKYKNLIDIRHTSNQLSNLQVKTMLDAVKEHYSIAQNYWKLKAKLLNIKDFKSSDVYANLNVKEEKYSFLNAYNIVYNALNIFDSEFSDLFKYAIDNKLLDAGLKKGKRSGAFCCGISTKHKPLMLMNFTNSLNDVSTLAHEFGHWLHDYYAITNQSKLNTNPPLVTCETASIFNEFLVFDYLKNILKDKVLLNYMLSKMDSIIATVFRQTAFSFFEIELFNASLNGAQSEDEISKIFEDNYKMLYGKAVSLTPNYKYQWAYVPHFVNSPFYVYAYAFGELATVSLYKSYLSSKDKNDFVLKYKRFLSYGSYLSPSVLYKTMNIDINKKETWINGLAYIDKISKDIKTML